MVHVMWGFCWRPISKVSSTPRETCSNPSIPPEPSRHPKKTSEKSAWTGLVRKITNEAIEEVKVRHNRSLEKVYPVVFFDCIVVRRLGSDFFDWDFSGSFWTSVAWLTETCGTKVVRKKNLIDWSSTCSVEEVGGKDDDDRPRPPPYHHHHHNNNNNIINSNNNININNNNNNIKININHHQEEKQSVSKFDEPKNQTAMPGRQLHWVLCHLLRRAACSFNRLIQLLPLRKLAAGTWKITPLKKGESSSKLSFLGFILAFRGVYMVQCE